MQWENGKSYSKPPLKRRVLIPKFRSSEFQFPMSFRILVTLKLAGVELIQLQAASCFWVKSEGRVKETLYGTLRPRITLPSTR